MNTLKNPWAPAVLLAGLMLLPVMRSAAAPGHLDVRFGTHGQLELPAMYSSTTLVRPDGRVLVVGGDLRTLGANVPRLMLTQWRADGSPDLAYGNQGRIEMQVPIWNDPVIAEAALQPDGKVLLSGAAGVGPRDTIETQWVRFLARLDPSGNPDPTFGTGGVVNGGFAGPGADGFGPGYRALRVLPGGDILALIEDGSTRFIDRFGPDGRRVASTPLVDGAVIDFVPDSDSTVIVLSRRNDGGVLWRLLPNGEIDTRFGDQGYVAVRNTYVSAMAVDPGGRVVVCSNTGVHAFDLQGRIDSAFGNAGDGVVRFERWQLPVPSSCDAIAVVDAGGGGSGDIVVVASKFRGDLGLIEGTLTARLDSRGRVDSRIGSGAGWAAIRGRQPPGTAWFPRAFLARESNSPIIVWYVRDAAETSTTILEAIDMGDRSSRGAAGLAGSALRVGEVEGSVALSVVRSGAPIGAARVRYQVLPGTATADDISITEGELRWADGDASSRDIRLQLADDGWLEGEESFELRLFDATGIDVPNEFTRITVVDDDVLRALRFDDNRITWTHGPDIPVSSWSRLNLRLDSPAAGPVTVYYLLENGVDSCCVGRVSWAAGESGSRHVPTYPGDFLGEAFLVELLDDTWRSLDQSAQVTVVSKGASPSPPPPSGGSPFNPAPNPNSGGSRGGGGAFDILAASACLALLLGIRPGRRRSLR